MIQTPIVDTHRLRVALRQTQELHLWITATLPRVVAALNDDPNDTLKAVDYNPTPTDRPLWCDHHETDIATCRARGRLCTGTPCSDISDPVGEAAIRTHPASQAAGTVGLLFDALATATGLKRDLEDWAPTPVTQHDRRQVDIGNTLDGCETCSTIGKHSHPKGPRPTTVTGTLPEPLVLCDWCWRHIKTHGRTPTRSELQRHHQDPRTRR